MNNFFFKLRVTLLVRYFKNKARRKVKPHLMGNHHYYISYIKSSKEHYFIGSGFSINPCATTEYLDIESLKSDLQIARNLYACKKIKELNNLIKESRKFKTEYLAIRNL